MERDKNFESINAMSEAEQDAWIARRNAIEKDRTVRYAEGNAAWAKFVEEAKKQNRFTIHWQMKNDSSGGHGSPVAKELAYAWAAAMNTQYPNIRHTVQEGKP